ncbi:hypothetical protein BJF82_03230 [Kytococcus sp. CUA-901]|nr:hypothetical protein BJF82_03230 [Kytococcus sp. CUA-901]
MRRLIAFRDYMAFVYGAEWKPLLGIAATVFGFATGFLPRWVPITLLVVSVLLVLLDGWEIYRRWKGARLLNNRDRLESYPFTGVVWSAEDGTFESLASIGAAQAPRIWTDHAVNAALAQSPALGAEAPVQVVTQPYQLPADLAGLSAQALRRTASPRASVDTRVKRPLWFNGRLARLMTEPTTTALEGSPFQFQQVRYFDGQTSNELWHWTRDRSLEDEEAVRLPRPYVVDAQGRLLSLGQARVANIVGISLVAVTSDDQVLMVIQSSQNSVNPGGFAVSASGSLDWADVTVREGTGLREVVLSGMLRELHEESGVHPDEVIRESARITAYFRWLARGAKPEFCGFVRRRVTSEEVLARRPMGQEVLFTQGTVAVPAALLLDPSSQWGRDLSALREHLEQVVPGTLNAGASTIATWHAAAALTSGS